MLASTADQAQFWRIVQNWQCYLARPLLTLFARISCHTFFGILVTYWSTLGRFCFWSLKSYQKLPQPTVNTITDLEAMTLSSLRIKVVISSGVIPMAAAAVKYGVSVLSQWDPQARKRKLESNNFSLFNAAQQGAGRVQVLMTKKIPEKVFCQTRRRNSKSANTVAFKKTGLFGKLLHE